MVAADILRELPRILSGPPVRPYAGTVTAFARRQGITLFPYVDVRSWDMDMVSWIYARHDAVRDLEGTSCMADAFRPPG